MTAVPLPTPHPTHLPPAPDIELLDAHGTSVRLSLLWANQPLALAVLPRYGTLACEDNASQLRENDELITEAGGQFVAIIEASQPEAAAFGREWNLDYTLLADPDGQVAAAFNLPKDAQGSTLPASFVIDTDGRVTHDHRAPAASAFPSVWMLVDEVEELTGKEIERPQLSVNFTDPARSKPLLNRNAQVPQSFVLPGAWSCMKCATGTFDVNDVATASGFLSRMFNLQNRRFKALTCAGCGYTELYKKDSPALMNIIDFMTGG